MQSISSKDQKYPPSGDHHIRPTNNFGIAQTQVQQCFDMSTRRHGSQFDFGSTGLPVDLAIIPIKVVEGVEGR